MSGPKRATCQVCRRPIAVKADGTLRHHTNPSAPRRDTIWAPRCDGADNYPLEENI